MIKPYYKSKDKKFYLLKGDTMDLLPKINHKFDMVFADPPYFLSNNGLSIQSGKVVSVNKGKWDKSHGFDYVNNFNRKWLKKVRELMKEDATIWISGTIHNIFSIGQILTELDFKILNIITWQKTNPPPNFSCRYFTYSTEQIIWARKSKNVPHYYNYELMKQLNGNKQMQDVWRLPAIAKWEKSCKKHPTQKPLSILTRLILASTKPNAWILDPFTGSSTTGIASNLANRRFLGIDKETEFLEISKCRKLEIENTEISELYKNKISGFNTQKEFVNYLKTEPKPVQKVALGFCRKKDIPNLTKTNKWNTRNYDYIDYIYPSNYDFNERDAQKSLSFCNDIIKRFNPSYSEQFEFYITNNIDDMGLLENFDYYYVGITTGKSVKGEILSAKGNEYYPHEFVHKLLPFNPNRNFILEEGLAEFLGSKIEGGEYIELMKKMAIDIEKGEKINFKSVISRKIQFNGYQTAYPAGAAICELVFAEKGDKGLLKLMLDDTSDYKKILLSIREITNLSENDIIKKWEKILKKYNS